MAKRISDESKLKQNRGTGVGADYVPWTFAREFNSRGTTTIVPDWKHGRGIQCLSQGEMLYYYLLRWDENTLDIREQYPLLSADGDMSETQQIAKDLGYRGTGHVMTTDFLVTERGGAYHAYAVKADRNISRREKEKLQIEASYWSRRNVPFTVLYKDDADRTLATNIRLVTRYFDKKDVFDRYSGIKHRIASGMYAADLSEKVLDVEFMERIEEANNNG